MRAKLPPSIPLNELGRHVWRPLWLVYGAEAFPQLLACTLCGGGDGLTIWGYSVWSGEGGYRTLGQRLGTFLPCQESGRPTGRLADGFLRGQELALFYASQEEALTALRKLTNPSRGALDHIERQRRQLEAD